MLTKNQCRHRCLPGLLPDSSVEEHVSQHSGMGSITGDIRHVRRRSYLRKALRQLRSAMAIAYRNLLPRLWSDDDLSLH